MEQQGGESRRITLHTAEDFAAMRRRLRLGFAGYAQQAFDRHCPQDTARQLDAWAQHRPKLGKYLKQED